MEKEIKRKRILSVLRLVLAFVVATLLSVVVFRPSEMRHGLVESLIWGASIAAILISIHFLERWHRVKKAGKKPTFEDLFDNRNKRVYDNDK